jgi:anaerobic magnesium-protoporphyrin IX monomethyl ester cyclase
MFERLDVLLVIPGDLSRVYQSLAEEHAIEPPAKARLIAAYLMRRNQSVDLIDANVMDCTPEMMANEVELRNPRLVVVPVYGFNPSSSTHTMPAARAYAQAIKDLCPTTPIIFTGTHPAALPAKTLREEPIDYVCDGEGPVTVYELLQALENGGSTKNVGSLWYLEDGVVTHNTPASLLDLNAEPAMDAWFLTDPRKYYAHDWHSFYVDYNDRSPYANVNGSEGCPFHCEFCNIQSPFRAGESLVQFDAVNSFRHLSPELFVKEIIFLYEKYGVSLVKIPDEMFFLGDYPMRIAELLIKWNPRVGDRLNMWCYSRVDTCNQKYLETMRRAGFRWLCLGIEAANSKVRSGQDKKFNEDRIYEVVKRMETVGIEGCLNYIFGLPNETSESMQETYDLAVSLNGTFSNFYCTQALPGSALYRQALANGYQLPERSDGPGWIGHSQYSYETEPYYVGSALTPQQILAFRDQAHVAYYSRPEYRARLLNDPKFGETAVKNIERMLARFPLKRKLLE